MTALSPCRSGDLGDERTVTLSGVADLASVSSVRALVSRDTSSTADVLTAAVADPDALTITVELGATGTDWLPAGPETGVWMIEYELTFNDGSVLTWPNDGYDTIRVIPELG